MKRFKHYINGKFLNGTTFCKTINPANGKAWAEFPIADEKESALAIEAAHNALFKGSWQNYTASQRGRLLYKLGDLIAQKANELGSIETTDSGKLKTETTSQAKYVAAYYHYYAGIADKIQGEVLPIDKPDMSVFTTREPIGVVVAIVPWNAQLFLCATKLAPAIAAGNTVVIKASEQAPIVLFELAKIIDKVGFPDGVINIISGLGEPCGNTLCSHPKVARVAFTGGSKVAKHIVNSSAHNFAYVSLELGGKSPMLIFDDCNIEGAINGIIAGNFGASGQSCVAGSRVFIQKHIYHKVISEIKKRAKNIIIGDPLNAKTQMGPLATTLQLKRAQHIIKKSIKQGAKLIFGGNKPTHLKSGWYFEPTLLDCPHQNIDCVNTELFAPIISTIAFENEQEAIQMANESEFGLGAGIFTENLARAHRVSKKIHAGIVWINTYRVISPMAPFGGFKKSGNSREAGMDAIYEYTRTKTTWINTSSKPMNNPFVIR